MEVKLEMSLESSVPLAMWKCYVSFRILPQFRSCTFRRRLRPPVTIDERRQIEMSFRNPAGDVQ